ncbi:hypothetical protein KSS87_015879 [Heliosperma pusillum]|nr:hypothetical protein KSS87_015879 [Heliosperma pusillum]
MGYQQDSYIIPQIQFTLLQKDQSSSSSSATNNNSDSSLLDPQIHVEFSLKDYILVASDSSNSFLSTSDPPLKLETMALLLHDNFCYKESIWMAMTCLGVQDRFINQVVEELEVKVGDLFTNFSDYVVSHPGLVVNQFFVHARVDIIRVKTGLSGSQDDADVGGFKGWAWASREYPVQWLE